MYKSNLRVLVVAEHASAKFGGEAALPLHYFRILKSRNIPVWLLVHARTRPELSSLFPEEIGTHILFIEDTILHRILYSFGTLLPDRIANFTVGFAMRILSQISQRKIIHRLIKNEAITVIHQPMPVSPKEPSLLFGFNVPVIIGPMNGGMDYPPSFLEQQEFFERVAIRLGRNLSNVLNFVIPGKRQAAVLLVANNRTWHALPECIKNNRIEILIENGVDLTLWKQQTSKRNPNVKTPTHFVFVGRLIKLKAVDFLIRAFDRAATNSLICLTIIGDGDERTNLEALTSELGRLGGSSQSGKIHFSGWLSQSECASRMESADSLVLPSLMECGGAVVLEAMAMSIPVIATNWGGPADYLDNTCGILINPDSRTSFLDDLTAALILMAEDPQLRLNMGHAGREKVLCQFDWEVKIDRIIQIYDSVNRI